MLIDVEIYLDKDDPDNPIAQQVDVDPNGVVQINSHRGSDFARFPSTEGQKLVIRLFPAPAKAPEPPPAPPEIFEWVGNGDHTMPIDTVAGAASTFSSFYFHTTDKNGVNKSYNQWASYLNGFDVKVLYDGVDAGFTQVTFMDTQQGNFGQFEAVTTPAASTIPLEDGVVVTLECTPK